MAKIQAKTWLQARWAWGVSFACLAFPCIKAAIEVPGALSVQMAILLIAPTLLSCFPFLGELDRWAIARRDRRMDIDRLNNPQRNP
jgi:hypothetical protein